MHFTINRVITNALEMHYLSNIFHKYTLYCTLKYTIHGVHCTVWVDSMSHNRVANDVSISMIFSLLMDTHRLTVHIQQTSAKNYSLINAKHKSQYN